MDEDRYTKAEREQMAREERSYQLWRAGVFAVALIVLLAGAWAIANAGAMRTYWLWSVGIAALIVAGFLTQGFGWINYGLMYALIFLGCAALVAALIQLRPANPPRCLCVPCESNRYDADALRSPAWKENRFPGCTLRPPSR
jgi:hypothetical protein